MRGTLLPPLLEAYKRVSPDISISCTSSMEIENSGQARIVQNAKYAPGTVPKSKE